MIELNHVQLVGTKCVINISQKPTTQGLTVLSTDPRKWRIKPDAYVGIVEKTGPRCETIQPGDRVVLERWEYKQADVDDERIIADESQVLVTQRPLKTNEWGPETPTVGVVVMRLINQLPKTQLTLPDAVIRRERKRNLLYYGEITNSASATVKPGYLCWVERRERHQFKTSDGRLMFINCQDSWGEFPIWMIGEKSRKPMEVLT